MMNSCFENGLIVPFFGALVLSLLYNVWNKELKSEREKQV